MTGPGIGNEAISDKDARARYAREFVAAATVKELQQAMASGRLTSRDIVQAYIERIGLYDKRGPALNAVLELNPEALFIAEALDVERAHKGPRGPLHGIPVLVKDSVDTADMMHTSAGSLALANSYARKDAFIARRLREAGAIILGKANMTEWANMMTDNMPPGYSSRGGQVRNPYGPGVYHPGGSSSGSAAAVAAGFVPVSVGTETSGSILSPARSNSVVGIKPTVGLWSRSGVIPISHIQDTPGPFGTTVEDAAILLGALTGIDQEDPATWASEGRAFGDYTQYLDKDGLKNARIGFVNAFSEETGEIDELSEESRSIIMGVKEVLKDAGACAVDALPPTPAPKHWRSTALVYEFKPAINKYLSNLSPNVPVHSLKELIEFNNNRPEKMLRYGQTTLIRSEATSGALTEPEYIEARAEVERMSRESIDSLLRDHKLDALLFPDILNCAVSAQAGYPSVAVPVGYTQEGKPVAVTFAGSAYSEPVLLRLAYAFEQLTKARKPPRLE
ncbi:MAG: amidase family protein [Bacillota bacterium]|jgi:amidase|nr:amidase [Candidatus Fermentithermobacillaceae bacterium]